MLFCFLSSRKQYSMLICKDLSGSKIHASLSWLWNVAWNTVPWARVCFWEPSTSSAYPASQSDPMWLNLNTSSKKAAQGPHKKPLGANLTSLYCFPPHLSGTPFRESSPSKIAHWEAPASGLSAQELCVPIFKVQLATLALCLWLPFLPREVGIA